MSTCARMSADGRTAVGSRSLATPQRAIPSNGMVCPVAGGQARRPFVVDCAGVTATSSEGRDLAVEERNEEFRRTASGRLRWRTQYVYSDTHVGRRERLF